MGFTVIRSTCVAYHILRIAFSPTPYGLRATRLSLSFSRRALLVVNRGAKSHIFRRQESAGEGRGTAPCSTSYSAVSSSSSSSSSSHLFSPYPSSVIPITSSRERAAYRAKKRASYLPGLFPRAFPLSCSTGLVVWSPGAHAKKGTGETCWGRGGEGGGREGKGGASFCPPPHAEGGT